METLLRTTGILVEAKDVGTLVWGACVPASDLSRQWESFGVGTREETSSRTGWQPLIKAKGTESLGAPLLTLLHASVQRAHPLRQAGAQS